MNNEDKILALLEQMNTRQSRTEAMITQMQVETNARFDKLERGQAEIKEDISYIKEDIAALQFSVDKIGTWAERVGPKVDIGLYDGD